MTPLLILLPGLDGTGRLMDDFVKALRPDVKGAVVRYPTERPLHYGELREYVRAYLPTEKPYFLLGESFSGPLSVSLAAENPTGFKGLILCCTFVKNPFPSLSILAPLLSRAPLQKLPMSLVGGAAWGRHGKPRLRSLLEKSLMEVDPSVMRRRLRSVLEVDVSSSLAKINAPILSLRAGKDFIVPSSAGEWIKKSNPRVEETVFDAPHLLLQTFPSAAARAVNKFINRRA